MKKKPSKSMKKKEDKRSNSMWLWVGVIVGKGKELYTHPNKKKRVTFMLLPNKEEAPQGKPRGLESIQQVLRQRITKKTFLVFDKWLSTVSATKKLGYKSAPPVNHSSGFRNKAGFHSNDVESENNRIKAFYRRRYGRMIMSKRVGLTNDKLLDMYEYTFRVNVGATFAHMMKALAKASYDDLLHRERTVDYGPNDENDE